MEQELLDAKSTIDRLHQEHKEKIYSMERKNLEEKAYLQEEMGRRVREIERSSREEAQKGLDTETKKIVRDNRRMVEELRFQLQTTDELQKEKNRLDEENRRLMREVSLGQEQEKEFHRKVWLDLMN